MLNGPVSLELQAIVTIHGWYFNLYPSYLSSMGGLKGKSKPETMVFPSKYGVVLWIFPQTNPMISPELGWNSCRIRGGSHLQVWDFGALLLSGWMWDITQPGNDNRYSYWTLPIEMVDFPIKDGGGSFHSYVNVHQRVYDSYDMFVDLGDDHPLTCHFKYIFSLNCFPDSWPIAFHSQFVLWKNWRAPIWLSHFLFLNMMVPWWTRTQMLLEQNLGMWRNTLEVLPFLKKHIFKKDQTGPINTPMVVS